MNTFDQLVTLAEAACLLAEYGKPLLTEEREERELARQLSEFGLLENYGGQYEITDTLASLDPTELRSYILEKLQ